MFETIESLANLAFTFIWIAGLIAKISKKDLSDLNFRQ